MQRSISHKNSLEPFIYVLLFVVYGSLSSIYLFLPPLFGVLFILFMQAVKRENTIFLLLVSFCLILYESQMNFPLFSSIIYFTVVYKFIVPKLNKNISCSSCVKFSYLLLVYLGYYFFLALLSNIFLFPMPSINYYIIYYIVIEFFIVSVL
jgi:hypothetical protein